MTSTTSLFAAPSRSTFVRSRGLDIAVAEWGDVAEASTVLVAAHGYLDCAEFFAPLAFQLQSRDADVAVVALSFAGHGQSSWADAYGWFDSTLDLMAVARSVLARVNEDSKVGFAGHSFGGLQVLQGLILEPMSADFVVNLDAVVAPPIGSRSAEALRYVAKRTSRPRALPVYATLGELVERRLASNPRLSVLDLDWLAPYFARRADTGWTWRVDPTLTGRQRPWEVFGAGHLEALQLARAVPHRILTITGAAEDHPELRGEYPGDAAIRLVDNIDHIRIPDAGHYVHIERPDLVADAILDYAGSATRRAR